MNSKTHQNFVQVVEFWASRSNNHFISDFELTDDIYKRTQCKSALYWCPYLLGCKECTMIYKVFISFLRLFRSSFENIVLYFSKGPLFFAIYELRSRFFALQRSYLTAIHHSFLSRVASRYPNYFAFY